MSEKINNKCNSELAEAVVIPPVWISVKDRLPELGVHVIALLAVRGKLKISSIQRENITTAENDIIEMNTWCGLINCQVTHWMELPSLPKEV